jgi:hypothetical protein
MLAGQGREREKKGVRLINMLVMKMHGKHGFLCMFVFCFFRRLNEVKLMSRNGEEGREPGIFI